MLAWPPQEVPKAALVLAWAQAQEFAPQALAAVKSAQRIPDPAKQPVDPAPQWQVRIPDVSQQAQEALVLPQAAPAALPKRP